MKNSEFQLRDFTSLTEEENQCCTGGGFAYDVGRAIRFIALSAPGGIFVANGIYDAVVNSL